jgi:hypothetical protein
MLPERPDGGIIPPPGKDGGGIEGRLIIPAEGGPEAPGISGVGETSCSVFVEVSCNMTPEGEIAFTRMRCSIVSPVFAI